MWWLYFANVHRVYTMIFCVWVFLPETGGSEGCVFSGADLCCVLVSSSPESHSEENDLPSAWRPALWFAQVRNITQINLLHNFIYYTVYGAYVYLSKVGPILAQNWRCKFIKFHWLWWPNLGQMDKMTLGKYWQYWRFKDDWNSSDSAGPTLAR